jgi:Concanavalin A-like lectin/glucanases superfamily
VARVAVTGAVWPTYRNARLGPFQDASFNLWVVAFNGSTKVTAYESTDGGATWATSYAAVGTFLTASLDCVFDSAAGVIYAAVQTTSNVVQIWSFTIGTTTWARVDSGTGPTVYADAGGLFPAFIAKRTVSAATEYVVLHQGALHNSTYRTASYARFAAGAWVAPVELDAGGNYNYSVKGICNGLAADRVHFLWYDARSTLLYCQERSLTAATTLSTVSNLTATGTAEEAAYFSIFYHPTLARLVVAAPTYTTTYRPVMRSAQDSGAANPQTWANDTNTAGTDEPATCPMVFAYSTVTSKLYAFFREYTSDDVYWNSVAASTWTTAAAAALDVATAATGISTGILATGIGVLHNDSGIYYDKLSIPNPHSYTAGIALEADAAQVQRASHPRTVTPSAEADATQVQRASHPRTVTPSAEADATVTLGITHVPATHITAGVTSETDRPAGAAVLYDDAILADGPKAFWPLNETGATTTILDQSGNTDNGTISGVYTLGSTALVADGEPSILIAGAGHVTGMTGSLPIAGPFTLELWCKPSASTQSTWLFDVCTNAQKGWGVSLSSGKPAYVAKWIAGYNGTGYALTAGNVYYIVVTVDGSNNLTIYRNASSIYSVATSIPNADSISATIGSKGDSSAYFSGNIAKVAVYDKALTPTQVTAHYAAAAGITSGGLTHSKQVTATPVAETDQAQTIRAGHPRTLASATEADQAQTIRAGHPRTLASAAETDQAQAISSTKPIHQIAAVTLETDAVQTAKAVKPRTLAPATETDQAQLAAGHKTLGIAPAAESDQAQTAKATKPRTLAPALESEAVQTAKPAKQRGVTPAAESDQAQAMSAGGAKTLASVTESDQAQGISFTKPIHEMLAPALEVDAAITVPASKRCAIAAALETDQAQAISSTKPIHASLAAAAELDVAATPTVRKRAQLVAALETDQAQTVRGSHARRLAPAAELDATLILFRFGLAPDIDLPTPLTADPAATTLAIRARITSLAAQTRTTTLAAKTRLTTLRAETIATGLNIDPATLELSIDSSETTNACDGDLILTHG